MDAINLEPEQSVSSFPTRGSPIGLCCSTTRWLDRLWAEHLEMSSPARDLVEAGIRKQGDPFAGFPSDTHARLDLPADPGAFTVVDHVVLGRGTFISMAERGLV